MKNCSALFLVFFLTLTFSSIGQIQKGNKMIGGTISLSSQEYKSPFSDSKYLGYNLNPNVGFFISNTIAIGGSLSIGGSSVEVNQNSGTSDYTDSSIGIQPFGRYYFIENLFAEMRFGIDRRKSKSKFTQSDGVVLDFDPQHYTDITFKGGIGYDYFIAENVALEGLLSYLITDFRNENSGNSKAKLLNFSVGIQVFIN